MTNGRVNQLAVLNLFIGNTANARVVQTAALSLASSNTANVRVVQQATMALVNSPAYSGTFARVNQLATMALVSSYPREGVFVTQGLVGFGYAMQTDAQVTQAGVDFGYKTQSDVKVSQAGVLFGYIGNTDVKMVRSGVLVAVKPLTGFRVDTAGNFFVSNQLNEVDPAANSNGNIQFTRTSFVATEFDEVTHYGDPTYPACRWSNTGIVFTPRYVDDATGLDH